jgi:hypothetical protein
MKTVCPYYCMSSHSEHSDVFTAVAMKNAVFWDIKTQFELQRRHITYPLQAQPVNAMKDLRFSRR